MNNNKSSGYYEQPIEGQMGILLITWSFAKRSNTLQVVTNYKKNICIIKNNYEPLLRHVPRRLPGNGEVVTTLNPAVVYHVGYLVMVRLS